MPSQNMVQIVRPQIITSSSPSTSQVRVQRDSSSPPKLIVASYVRVSTTDKNQNPQIQLDRNAELCKRMGWDWKEYVDYESGKDVSLTQRVQFLKMFEDLRSDKLDGIVVVRPDRFTRDVGDCKRYMKEIQQLNKFLWVVDHGRKYDAASRRTEIAMLYLQSAVDGMETAATGDRVQDTYEHIKSITPEGQKPRWGRKPNRVVASRTINPKTNKVQLRLREVTTEDLDKIKKLHQQGLSLREIARVMGCSHMFIKTVIESGE